MSNTRQIVRQLDILRVFAARRHGASIQELVDDFGVTRRTIERDLNDLGVAGFPLYKEKRCRRNLWKLLHDKEIPTLNFPISELIALTFITGIL